MTVSTRSVRPVIWRLRALAIDVEPVIAVAGCDAAVLKDPEARIPHEAALALWGEAVTRAGDDAFGIHAAEQVRPGAFDVLDYAVRSSATLGEGFQRLVRYQRVLHGTAAIELKEYFDRVELTHLPPYPVSIFSRHMAEFLVAVWVTMARQGTGTDFTPIEVMFRHPRPADISEHERFFRAPIRFASSVNGFAVQHSMLDLPGINPDPGLGAVLTRHLDKLIAKMPLATSFGVRVREVIAEDLSMGVPGAAEVAERLHMSLRTLQRFLHDEGTTFADLVDSLRSDLATRYLREPAIAIAEVAYLLGFSEASAFHRAFKRWHGVTPAAYRSAQSPSPPGR